MVASEAGVGVIEVASEAEVVETEEAGVGDVEVVAEDLETVEVVGEDLETVEVDVAEDLGGGEVTEGEEVVSHH